MEYTNKRSSLMAFSAAAIMLTAGATDNAHMYKPPMLYGTSPTCWFEHKKGCDTKNWLTKLDFSYSGGDTDDAWNGNGNSTNVLNIPGPTNMIFLSENVVKTPSINDWANYIAANPGLKIGQGGTFGLMEFDGKFKMQEFDVSWRQNIVAGFFLEASLPVRELKFTNISYTDLSPATDNGGFNKSTWQWVQFKNNLDAILNDYGLTSLTGSWKKSGVGDLSVYLGWEQMWKMGDDWKHWIGLTLKAGVICPTGDSHDNNHVFSMPLGFEENVGLGGFAQLQFGIVRWFTLRIHGSGTGFLEGDAKAYRMKTFNKQTGWLSLASGNAKETEGALWHIGADIAFDHILGGLSARFGYSFTEQEAGELKPTGPSATSSSFSRPLADSNPWFQEWYLHTVHFMLDYDFSVHAKKWAFAPRLAAFCNLPFDGKNAFKTTTFGGTVGLDIRWKV